MKDDSPHWHRIEPALDRLLTAPPAERAQLLEQLAGHDPELHRELSSLLSAHLAAGTFLDQPAMSLVDPPDLDGRITPDRCQPFPVR